MWEQYVEKARQEVGALGERALEVRFEDLLMRPEQAVQTIARFCRIQAPPDRQLLDGLAAGRAFAYRRDPELVGFADSVRTILARYGYEP